MNLKYDQLENTLQNKDFAHYLLFGGEVLLFEESLNTLRKHAKMQGIDERLQLSIDNVDDLERLLALINAPSLFATKRLIECTLKLKMSAKTSKLINTILEIEKEDVLVFITGKLDFQQQKSKWFLAFSKYGCTLQHLEVPAYQLLSWVERRMQTMGMPVDKNIASLITFYTEGNLLATHQELVKLQLAYPDGNVNIKEFEDQMVQQSRYSIFGLIDSCLKGDVAQICKIHGVLKQDNTPIPMIIGALSKEIQQLINMAIDLRLKKTMSAILDEYKIWRNKIQITQQALERLPYGILQKNLMSLGQIERSSKGIGTLNVWDELLNVCLNLAGEKLWK
jgi:DNA polymerase-3 subunit delta